MEYTVEYFINKFESIPDEKWCTSHLFTESTEGFRCCALGHLDVRYDPELKDWRSTEASSALITLLGGDPQSTKYDTKWGVVSFINDVRFEDLTWQNSTPRERILSALVSKLNTVQ